MFMYFFFLSRKAQNLLNSIKKLTVNRDQVDALKDRLGVLQKLLDDLLKRIEENVRKPVARTIETYQIGLARKEAVLVSTRQYFLLNNYINYVSC